MNNCLCFTYIEIYYCFLIRTIAKYCPSVRQTVHPPGQPSEKSTKSAKRIERDNARMSAYNARKASIANMPFASVPTDEFKTLLPRPDHNRDSKSQKDTIHKYEKQIDELKSKLNDSKLEINCIEFDLKDLQNENNELHKKIVWKKHKNRECMEQVKEKFDAKESELESLKDTIDHLAKDNSELIGYKEASDENYARVKDLEDYLEKLRNWNYNLQSYRNECNRRIKKLEKQLKDSGIVSPENNDEPGSARRCNRPFGLPSRADRRDRRTHPLHSRS